MHKLHFERNGHRAVESHIVKRAVVIAGYKKSISLEPAVWKSLKEIAAYQGTTLLALVTTIDSNRNGRHLSSAARLFVLNFYLKQLDIQNRRKAVESALHCAIRGLH
jgi:predicted DNA-binding ribbon-helix-helix protein